MSLQAPSDSRIDGRPFSFGIAAARFNADLVDALLHSVYHALTTAGVKERNVTILRVPGSHEVPTAAQWLAQGAGCDAVIALGVLIAGDTNHHEVVAVGVTHALQRLALDTGVPVINGVIAVENMEQAEARCRGEINRGGEFARAALEMAALRRSLASPRRGKGRSR